MIDIPFSPTSKEQYPDLKNISPQWIQDIQSKIQQNSNSTPKNLLDIPPPPIPISNPEEYIPIGKDAFIKGKVAFFIAAGGQASRLGTNLPKALVPITPYRKVHSLQRLIERLESFNTIHNIPVPTALMVNPNSLLAIQSEVKRLTKLPIELLAQPLLPIFNQKGNCFLSSKSRLALAPGGNGCSLKLLHDSEFYSSWLDKGVEHVLFFQIDNPLYNPFDFSLLGQHIANQNDATILTISKNSPSEKVGTIVNTPNGLRVVEYSELEKSCPNINPKQYPYANISIFAFSSQAVKKASEYTPKMPWHLAHKKVSFLNQQGEVIHPLNPNAFKAEQFIFDIFESIKKIDLQARDRFSCFSPLKNATGPDSFESVHHDLLKFDQWFYQKKFHKPLPEKKELHPSLYLIDDLDYSKVQEKDQYIFIGT